MNWARQAHCGGSDSAGREIQGREYCATAATDEAFGRRRIGFGGDPAGHVRRTGNCYEGEITAVDLFAECCDGSRFLRYRSGNGIQAAEVVAKGKVDDPVRLGGSRAEDLEISQTPPQHLGALLFGSCRGHPEERLPRRDHDRGARRPWRSRPDRPARRRTRHLAFKRGYAGWSEADSADEFAPYALNALAELRAATASLG